MKFIQRSKHYGIERFGITFMALVIAMGGTLVVFGIEGARAAMAERLKQTIYIGECESSVAKVPLKVDKVCVDESRQHGFVLFRLGEATKDNSASSSSSTTSSSSSNASSSSSSSSSSDKTMVSIDSISTDAKSYNARVTAVSDDGSSPKRLETPGLSGQVYVFGNTGYLGVYLTSTAPFARERVAIGLETSYVASKAKDQASTDNWRFDVNLGADGVTTVSSLANSSFDAADFYAQTVLDDVHNAARKALDDDLSTMSARLHSIEEAYGRVSRDGVSMDGHVPAYVSGDEVQTDDNGNLSLTTDTVAWQGYNFDWRSRDLVSSYMNAVCGREDMVSYLRYVRDGAGSTVSSADEDPYTKSKAQPKWVMADGSDVSESGSTTAAADTKALDAAWTAYMEAKHDYQTKHMNVLFYLEMEKIAMSKEYTTNTDAGSFTVVGA